MAIRRVSPLATRSEHRRLAAVDRNLLERKARDAAVNPRLREIHCLHSSDDALLQRMLNAMQPGTYGRPHRHLAPPKDEGFVLLSGRAGVAVFEEDGALREENMVLLDRAAGALAVDIRSGAWHTLVCLAPDTVLYEVKNGPYAAADDKDFAPWAPVPDTEEAKAFEADLAARFARRFGLED
ncbi:MAG: WbuC family cupin fold metalloprotein [Thermodesulfobacteriota bacterium]